MTTHPALPTSNPLAKRQQMILFSVIAEYITTGAPVGSKTLAEKHGLHTELHISTATEQSLSVMLE